MNKPVLVVIFVFLVFTTNLFAGDAVCMKVSNTSGTVPLTIEFDATPAGGTSPYTYAWNFGDGGSSTLKNPTHTYTVAGTYTATVIVTDSSQPAAQQATCSQEIVANASLSLSISADHTSGTIPLAVNFTATPSGGTGSYSWYWTFGDGGSSSLQNPSHNYTIAGTYTATCRVSSGTENAEDSLTINVNAGLSVTGNANPTSGPIPLNVAFTATATGGTGTYAWYWEFGDGGSSSLQNPSHTYTTEGTFNAVVHVSSGSENASATVSITAFEGLGVNCTASPTSGVKPLLVSFTSTPTGGTGSYTYYWEFGDGGSSTQQNPNHTYNSAGNFTAVVHVSSGSENATCSKQVSIYNPLTVTCSATPH